MTEPRVTPETPFEPPAENVAVTALRLVGRWDVRHEAAACAEVMIYAKIEPQPSAKVPILHIQDLIQNVSLVRVVPLLPNGTSPWESPGVEQLNVSTVRGRERKSYILLDELIEAASATEKVFEAVDPDRGPSSEDTDGLWKYKTPELGIRSSSIPRASLAIHSASMDGARTICTDGVVDDCDVRAAFTQDHGCSHSASILPHPPCQMPSTPHSPVLGRLDGPEQGAGLKVSYARDRDGNMRPVEVYDWERIHSFDTATNPNTKMQVRRRSGLACQNLPDYDGPRVDSHGRILSGGSYRSLGGFSSIGDETNDILQHFSASTGFPSLALIPHLQGDGTAKGKETHAFPRGVAEIVPLLKRTAERVNSKPSVDDPGKTTVVIEDDSLCISFPPEIRSDSQVFEILITLKPLILPHKSSIAFILSGLPRCENEVSFSFEILDDYDQEWLFDVYPPAHTIESSHDDDNQICGSIHLKESSSHSLIIRALNIPSYVEIHDFKIRTKSSVLVAWSPTHGVTADFEIRVHFVDIQPALHVPKNLVNLLLLNAPESMQNLEISSGTGTPLRFSLEGTVFKHGEYIRDCRFLQVCREALDVRESITISFRKKVEVTPAWIDIPVVEPGSERDILEQLIVVHPTRLPVRLDCTSGSTWDEPRQIAGDPLGSKRLMRILGSTESTYPKLRIDCLNPVRTQATDSLEKDALWREYLDAVQYDFQEHSEWKPHNPMSLRARLKFKIERPPGVEYGALITTISCGSFRADFATINGKPVMRGALFNKGDDVMIMNHGLLDHSCTSVGVADRSRIEVFFTAVKAHKVSVFGGGQAVELCLPSILQATVGRIVCKYQKDNARIITKTQDGAEDDGPLSPRSGSGSYSIGFVGGKVTLSGDQSFHTRLYLQIIDFSPRSSSDSETSVSEPGISSVPLYLSSPVEESFVMAHLKLPAMDEILDDVPVPQSNTADYGGYWERTTTVQLLQGISLTVVFILINIWQAFSNRIVLSSAEPVATAIAVDVGIPRGAPDTILCPSTRGIPQLGESKVDIFSSSVAMPISSCYERLLGEDDTPKAPYVTQTVLDGGRTTYQRVEEEAEGEVTRQHELSTFLDQSLIKDLYHAIWDWLQHFFPRS